MIGEGDRSRYDSDRRYRWVIHRVWIAIGNESAVLERATQHPSVWRTLPLMRNELAHQRLPDIDDDMV